MSQPQLSAISCSVADGLPDYITGFCLSKPSLSPDTLSTANLPASPSNPYFLFAKACQRILLGSDAHYVLPPAHLWGFPRPRGANSISRNRPYLHRMLARQRLLHGLLYPSLLEHPSSRRSAREEAVRAAGVGVLIFCRLDRDPHLRLPPTTLHQVCSRLVSLGLRRGGLLSWVPVRFRLVLGG